MESLVLLVHDSIESVLEGLPPLWRCDRTRPAGATQDRPAATGPVGAWIDFYGIVRDSEPTVPDSPSERRILAIEYEAHAEMAQHQLELLLERIGTIYPVHALLVIHRLGRVPVGEASLLVRVLSGHRGESLRACAELNDELKKWVPIWKHPVFA